MRSRRQAFALAAVLAATVLTGGAAIAGLAQGHAQPVPARNVVLQVPAQAAPVAVVAQPREHAEGGD